tara:strand:- start:25 stop:231 length:207 start_codon:yes stop_codon:yes gene_type:complete
MMILNYESKKELKTKIGEELNYTETTFFEPEYKSTGTFAGCNRPHMTGYKREFFAEVTMKDDKIVKVK